MRAILLSIGDELTLGQSLDTNSQWLAARLAEQSILVIEHRTLPDDMLQIADAMRECAPRCEVLIVTGGLGPTDDDLTREGLGQAFFPGESLVSDEAAARDLEQWFARAARPMAVMNMRQCLRPRSFLCLPNPHGTAPGLCGEHGGCAVFSLPGPPREMQPMFQNHVLPRLPRSSEECLLTARVQEFGMGESDAASKLGDLMQRGRNPLVGTTASNSIVSARIRARGERVHAQAQLSQTVDEVLERWRPYAFGRGDETLVDAVAALMEEQSLTLTTAESCTGGWLAKTIVDRAGSSSFFLGGWVTYSNGLKVALLGIDQDLIHRHGAVSHEVALAMARSARARAGADCALAITGVAGPAGGTSEKPVGTVHIALSAQPGGNAPERIDCRRFRFPGERSVVRDRSVKAALQMLRLMLMSSGETPLIWETTQRSGTS